MQRYTQNLNRLELPSGFHIWLLTAAALAGIMGKGRGWFGVGGRRGPHSQARSASGCRRYRYAGFRYAGFRDGTRIDAHLGCLGNRIVNGRLICAPDVCPGVGMSGITVHVRNPIEGSRFREDVAVRRFSPL